jgi:hypothetical protein
LDAKEFQAAYDHELPLRPAQQHVHASTIAKDAQCGPTDVIVVPHERNDDEISFASLEGIDGALESGGVGRGREPRDVGQAARKAVLDGAAQALYLLVVG